MRTAYKYKNNGIFELFLLLSRDPRAEILCASKCARKYANQSEVFIGLPRDVVALSRAHAHEEGNAIIRDMCVCLCACVSLHICASMSSLFHVYTRGMSLYVDMRSCIQQEENRTHHTHSTTNRLRPVCVCPDMKRARARPTNTKP